MKRTQIITTGGTIDKEYVEHDGSLVNKGSLIATRIKTELRLPHKELVFHHPFAKDSLLMTDEDRLSLALLIEGLLHLDDPILVIHGTDTMCQSLEFCRSRFAPRKPVVFTGAMRPYGYVNSDALQNIAEALIAGDVLGPGFYISFHGAVYPDGRARKNIDLLTFESV